MSGEKMSPEEDYQRQSQTTATATPFAPPSNKE